MKCRRVIAETRDMCILGAQVRGPAVHCAGQEGLLAPFPATAAAFVRPQPTSTSSRRAMLSLLQAAQDDIDILREHMVAERAKAEAARKDVADMAARLETVQTYKPKMFWGAHLLGRGRGAGCWLG